MARHRFGGIADYVISAGVDDVATLEPSTTVTTWNLSSGGSQYTDLVETDGVTPVTGGALTTDSVGSVPEFLGPDGIREVYFDASGGSGPRRRALATDLGSDLTTVESDLSSHTGAVNPHGTTMAGLSDVSATTPKGGARLLYDTLTTKWANDGASTALMGWHSALANRHFARANVVMIGDSITEGQGATAFDNSIPARLRKLLRSRFPIDGLTGTAGGQGWINAAGTGTGTFTWPAAVTGGPTYNDDWGPKRHTPQLDAAAPADKITYTNLQGTAVDIMWTRFDFGGNFRYRVDAGSWTTVATGGGQLDGQLTRVSLGASGTHTLEIEANSGGFQAFVSGVIVYDGDESKGIQVHDCAHWGWDTTSWISAVTSAQSWPAAIAALNPALITITLGANDQFLNTDPATFQSNLVTLVSGLRAATGAPSPFPPILLAMHAQRGDGPFTYEWSEYVNAAYAVADSDALVTVFDMTLGPRMPNESDSPNHSLYADDVHLNNRGCTYIADRLADYISPR